MDQNPVMNLVVFAFGVAFFAYFGYRMYKQGKIDKEDIMYIGLLILPILIAFYLFQNKQDFQAQNLIDKAFQILGVVVSFVFPAACVLFIQQNETYVKSKENIDELVLEFKKEINGNYQFALWFFFFLAFFLGMFLLGGFFAGLEIWFMGVMYGFLMYAIIPREDQIKSVEFSFTKFLEKKSQKK